MERLVSTCASLPASVCVEQLAAAAQTHGPCGKDDTVLAYLPMQARSRNAQLISCSCSQACGVLKPARGHVFESKLHARSRLVHNVRERLMTMHPLNTFELRWCLLHLPPNEIGLMFSMRGLEQRKWSHRIATGPIRAQISHQAHENPLGGSV